MASIKYPAISCDANILLTCGEQECPRVFHHLTIRVATLNQ